MRSRPQRLKTITSVGQCLLAVASSTFVWFQYLTGTSTNNPVLLTVFFLFSTTIILDRIGNITSSYTLEKSEDEIWEMISKLPGDFVGRNDITAFPNEEQASAYCVAILPLAHHVKNTLLRYSARSSIESDDYENEWLIAKLEAVKRNNCNFMEIVSSQINHDHFQEKVVRPFGEMRRSSRYDWRILDEKRYPMMQLVIMEFADGAKEIVFGWAFPGLPQGPCFVTKNDRLIQFFENYFMYHFKELSALPPSLGISEH